MLTSINKRARRFPTLSANDERQPLLQENSMIRQPRSSRSHYRRLALALSLGMALGGCQRSPDPAKLVAEARQYRQAGDVNAAVIQLKNALQKDPDNRDARRLLGEIYIDQADPVSAEKELRRAMQLGAPSIELVILLGKSVLLQGQYTRLLDEFTSAPDPAGQPAILALRAGALLGLGKLPEAKTLFEEALRAEPALADALLGLARIAMAEHQPEPAARLVGRALAAHPLDADSLRLKGDLLRIDGKPDAALAAYRAILAVHPHNAQARVDVASLLTDNGKFAEARAELKAARKLSPGRLSVAYAQAMLDYRESKYPAATETLQQILRAAPDYTPAILLLGAIEWSTGANALAEQHLQTFLAAYPAHLHATKLMAALDLRVNNSEAALALLAPALKNHPGDADLLTLAGEANMRARRFDRAADYFEQASALRPRQPNLLTAAALGRLGNGETERALAGFEQAAVLDIKSPRTGTLLVMSYLRANSLDKALGAVRDMERQGDSASVQNLKGGVLLARQDVPGARASFGKAVALDPLYLPALDNLAQLDVLEHRPADAARRYQDALARSPHNTALMEALARLAARRGLALEATGWLERACRDNPDSVPLALRLADAYVRGGDAPRALVLAQKLQVSHPANPDVVGMVAQLYALRQNLPAAAETYSRLAQLMPASARPQLRIAATYLAMHDESAALAALRRAAALEPDLMEAQQMLSKLLIGQKNFADAAAVASALQQRRPKSGGGYQLEGDVKSAQGLPAAALAAWERGFALEPSGDLVMRLAGALGALGKTADADARMAQWLRQHPDDVGARLHDASSKLVRNNVRAAIVQLEAVLRQAPNNVLALNELALASQRIGDGRALGYAERAHALAPVSAGVMDSLGWICFEGGDLARALPLLRKASALAPASPEIGYHFAVVLAKSGDKRGARDELERLLAAPGESARRADARALLATL
jgi:putative PEP-CTERM system TPR-repeat lipoprotein